jgi:hypothetical protein
MYIGRGKRQNDRQQTVTYREGCVMTSDGLKWQCGYTWYYVVVILLSLIEKMEKNSC